MRLLCVTDELGTGKLWMVGNRRTRLFNIVRNPLIITPDKEIYIKKSVNFWNPKTKRYEFIFFLCSSSDGEELLKILSDSGFSTDRLDDNFWEVSDPYYINPNQEYPLMMGNGFYFSFNLRIKCRFYVYIQENDLQRFLTFLGTLRENYKFSSFYYDISGKNCLLM